MFLDEVSRFRFLKFLTEIFSQPQIIPETLSCTHSDFPKPIVDVAGRIKYSILFCSCFTVLIPHPHAYQIVSKDHFCCFDYNIALGMIVHMGHPSHLSPFQSQFQVLAVHVKAPHTTPSIFWLCIKLCGNTCWPRRSVRPRKSGGSSQLNFSYQNFLSPEGFWRCYFAFIFVGFCCYLKTLIINICFLLNMYFLVVLITNTCK